MQIISYPLRNALFALTILTPAFALAQAPNPQPLPSDVNLPALRAARDACVAECACAQGSFQAAAASSSVLPLNPIRSAKAAGQRSRPHAPSGGIETNLHIWRGMLADGGIQNQTAKDTKRLRLFSLHLRGARGQEYPHSLIFLPALSPSTIEAIWADCMIAPLITRSRACR